MHVNVLWGKGAAENFDGQAVVDTANTLRVHFVKKRNKAKGLVVNGKLTDFQTLLFRGRDKKDRMVLLMLNTEARQEGESLEDALKRVWLLLSYIVKPDNPDMRKITIKGR